MIDRVNDSRSATEKQEEEEDDDEGGVDGP